MAKKGNSTISLANLLKRKVEKPEFEELPTGVEGRSLIVEGGTDPQIARKIARRDLGIFASHLWRYGRQHAKIAKWQKLQERQRRPLIDFAKRNEGVRGMEHLGRDQRVPIYPKRTIQFHREPTQEVLGAAYSGVVGEDLQVGFIVPLGRTTPDGRPLTPEMLLGAMCAGVMELGIEGTEIPDMLSYEVALRVDEKKLYEMHEAGQIVISDAMATITETWVIDPSRPNS